jgi:hypothetical protein
MTIPQYVLQHIYINKLVQSFQTARNNLIDVFGQLSPATTSAAANPTIFSTVRYAQKNIHSVAKLISACIPIKIELLRKLQSILFFSFQEAHFFHLHNCRRPPELPR